MKWINVKDELPRELEKVLVTDGCVYFVGRFQETNLKQRVWWACNPNSESLGHAEFLVLVKPIAWCKIDKPGW